MDEELLPTNRALAAEALAAGVGVLSEDPITDGDVIAARRLPKRWAAQVAAFMKDEKSDPPKPQAPADMEKILDKLTAPVEPLERVRENIGDAELGRAVLDVIVNARNALASQWPTVVIAQAWGPELLEASPTEKRRAAALLRVVDDPDAFIAELRAHTIEPAQVALFQLCYPNLFQMLSDMLWEHVMTLNAKKRLRWSLELVLRVLWDVPPQKQIETPRGTPKSGSAAAPRTTDKLRTKAQRLTD
jgi:hypothetical protein